MKKDSTKNKAKEPVELKPVPKGEKLKIGKPIEFVGVRLSSGNPVTGILLSEDDEWMEVKLTKDISGLVNEWFAGETRSFRKSLTNSIKQ